MDYNEIATIIKDRRAELELTQLDVAKKAKVSLKVIHQIESGHFSRMLLNTFLRVLHALGLKLELVDKEDIVLAERIDRLEKNPEIAIDWNEIKKGVNN